MFKKVFYTAAVFTAAVLFSIIPAKKVFAEETENAAAIKIMTADDMMKIKDAPDQTYILDNDIDMAGYDWIPFRFSGTFDGNGHKILNLTVKKTSSETAVTYDGNMKEYETCFAGLFGILEKATVKNVTLESEKVIINETKPCFTALIAGYSDGGTIENCTVTSSTVYLSVNAPMFGTGGILGYGNGKLDGCTINATLICIDENKDELDEQFLGGAYAGGYADITNCNITIDGYDSDHGYVHNGGLAGIFIYYPKGFRGNATIANNAVNGKITFFEDNRDRRAYCKSFIGEIMDWNFKSSNNRYGDKAIDSRDESIKNEVKDYSTVLLPTDSSKYALPTPTPTPTLAPTPTPTVTPSPTPTEAPIITPVSETEPAITPTPVPAASSNNSLARTVLIFIMILAVTAIIVTVVMFRKR